MRCLLALLAAAAALIGADAARPTWEQLSASYSYEQFLADFGKSSPATSEYAIRRNLFQERLAAALQHNANPASSWKRGVNHMSDWTEGERKALRGGLRSEAAMRTSMLRHQPRQRPAVGIPSSFDWRSQRGIVTPVKDQGHCGSCWAFASTAVLESHLAIQTGVFAELSPQNLVSCVPNPNQCGGYGGCAGSTADLAFGYVKEHGIASPYSFPYVSWPGDSNGTCAVTPASRATPVANISGHVNLPANEEAPLLEALVAHGPIAVSVAAMPWSDYESGVFDGCGFEGEGTDVDHVVVLVGYDEDSLIIRNSWTPLWGESGYIRLKRTTNCGIDRSPQDGNGCAGGPNDIKVCGMCGVLSDNAYPTGTQLAR